jgi:hypothetical protein
LRKKYPDRFKLKKRKLIAGDGTLVFTKDLEISFLDGLDIGRFRIAKNAWCPCQSTFEAKIFLHSQTNKRKTSRSFIYGNYGDLRSIPKQCKVVLLIFIFTVYIPKF